MTSKVPPPMPPLVLVEWEDVKVKDDGPWTENKEPQYEPHLVHQVGFLVKDLPAGVILTHAWHPDLVAPHEQIPRGTIRSIRVLNAAPVARKRTRK